MRDTKADKIKRMVRTLKKEESRMLCGLLKIDNISSSHLVWNDFFELKEKHKVNGKYNLDELVNMSEGEFEQAINEYFEAVLVHFYNREETDLLHPILNIPRDADMETAKRKFRELAKKLHPDIGGSSEDFTTLHKAYQEFVKNNK